MKKVLCLLFACILCSALVFTACSNKEPEESEEPAEEVTEETESPDLTKMMIGKWSIQERDGKPAPTNQKAILTLVTPEKAYISASFSELGSTDWENSHEMDVVIDRDKVTLTRKVNKHTTLVDEVTASEITDSEVNGNLVVKKIKDGTEETLIDQSIKMVRVNEDYSKDIIGTWEGHRTSEEGDYDDGEDHRWEYKDDGTYVYYAKENGQWTAVEQKINDYFVDGDLLLTRWENNGKEADELWEIKISGDKMNWTATRYNDKDQTMYTASFEMTRVND